MTKRQRGFKQARKKFFYKEDIFLSRMASVLKLPQSKVKELFFQKTAFCVQLNKIKKEVLIQKGFEIEEVEWFEDTYIVKNESEQTLKKMSEYKRGDLDVYNMAELIPFVVLDAKDDESFLHMNFEKWDTTDSGESYKKILLSAPSSREGNVSFLKKRSLKNWEIKKSTSLAKSQKELIVKAFGLLEKGGLLVYTTTTISPNENEGVVSHLLAEKKDAVLKDIELLKDEKFKMYKNFIKSGLKEWNDETYHPDIVKTIRTIPGKTMLGSFTALIQKV